MLSTIRYCFLIMAAILLTSVSINAQTTQWGHRFGGPGNSRSYMTKVAPNGNVFVGGYFSGTTDLDPSAGTYNITSNGSEDIFLACYSATGVFQWGFNIGGTSIDAIGDISFDAQNNVLVSGYFRGTNVDFNPGVGTAFLTDNGTNSSSIPWGGDGFVAKFNSAGVYQWAFQIGGTWAYDMVESIETDAQGNVYVGGVYLDDADLDPSAGSLMINGVVNGKSYLAKYTPGGQLIWGFGFLSQGAGGTDCAVRGMMISGSEIYICGFVEDFSDFDPSSNTASWLTNSSGDPYVAKYDTAGNYIWHYVASGNTFEESQELALDQSNNVYVTGYSSGSNLTFGTNVVTAPGGGGNSDIYIGKWNSSGVLQWAYMMGGPQGDLGTGIVFADNHIFCTGYFGGTADLDPSAAVNSFTSAGSSDIYVTKYDLNGAYVCGFRAGSTGVDEGWAINADASNQIHVAGDFSGTVDFDPSAQTYNMTASAPYSAFVAKYVNTTGGSFQVVGDTICVGQQAYVTITDVINGGTFSVTINDGSSNYTFPNVQSGVPFAMVPNPSVTTTYTWTVAGGGGGCISGVSSGSFTIIVNPTPIANAGPDISVCNNSTVQLNGTGGTTYSWTPGGVLSNPNVSNPTMTINDTTITFTMVTTNSNGCSDTDQVNVSVHQGVALANAGPDTSACPGAPVVLQGSGVGNYNWFPSTGLSSTNIANPTFSSGTTSTVYLEMTDQFNCKDTDEVVITMLPQPVASAGPDQQVCGGHSVTLQASGGNTYNWYPTTGMTGSNTPNPSVTVMTSTTYYVIVSNGIGCTDTDAVNVSVIPGAVFNIVSDKNICPGDSMMLYAGGGETYYWYPQVNMSANGNDTVWVWPVDSTTYYVAITSSLCTTADTLFVNVNVQPAPDVQIVQAGPKLCGDQFGQLLATGAQSYMWSPAATLDSAGKANPRSNAQVSTWYTVTGYSEHGCKATDSALMRVEGENLTGLFVPSVFTPNADGKNDCYRILLPPGATEYELHIYNRWGENVYNADDATDCWDGTFNGESCDLGVYFYYYKLKAANCNEAREGKGDITLLR